MLKITSSSLSIKQHQQHLRFMKMIFQIWKGILTTNERVRIFLKIKYKFYWMSIPTFNSFFTFMISSLTPQSLVFRFVCVDHSHIFYCCGNFCFLNISFLMPLEILLAFSSSFLFYLEWKKFNNSLALWMLTIFIFRFVRIISSKSIMKFSYWGLWIFGKHQKKKNSNFLKTNF